MVLTSHDAWIFDLDGTLTVDMHDFREIQRRLGLKDDAKLLEYLDALPVEQAKPLREILEAWELEVAQKSVAKPFARELLCDLRERGHRFGILTRNAASHARVTLEAAGLAEFFPEDVLIARDHLPPKPNPHGIQHLMTHFQARPERTVMIGDYVFDLEAGRAAGVTTVHVDVNGVFAWPQHADLMIRCLSELRPYLRRG